MPLYGKEITMEFEKIQEIISEQMNISTEEIKLETAFEDLGADSLDIFQIITELEEVYEVEFDTEDADKIKTVGDAVDYIKAALEEN